MNPPFAMHSGLITTKLITAFEENTLKRPSHPLSCVLVLPKTSFDCHYLPKILKSKLTVTKRIELEIGAHCFLTGDMNVNGPSAVSDSFWKPTTVTVLCWLQNEAAKTRWPVNESNEMAAEVTALFAGKETTFSPSPSKSAPAVAQDAQGGGDTDQLRSTNSSSSSSSNSKSNSSSSRSGGAIGDAVKCTSVAASKRSLPITEESARKKKCTVLL
uniref:Uncharacterized protein n=1 Tax=Octactis speculum TaxID=3111310 RepID=A0A7S2APF3_9STRA